MKILTLTAHPNPAHFLREFGIDLHCTGTVILNTLEIPFGGKFSDHEFMVIARLSASGDIFSQQITQPPLPNLSEIIESLRDEPYFFEKECRDPSICESNNLKKWKQEARRIRTQHKQRQLKIPH